MSLICLSSLGELERYRSDLAEMEHRPFTATLYTSYKWIKTWIESYNTGQKLVLLLLSKNGKISAFFPLILVPATFCGIRMKRLEFISLASHGDMICPRWFGNFDEFADDLLEFLADSPFNWDYFYFQSLCDKSPCVSRFAKLSRQNGFNFLIGDLVNDQRSWYVPFKHNWQDYFNSLSRHTKQSIHNKTNRMRKDGTVEIQHETKYNAHSQFWQDLLDADKNSWQFKNGSGISSQKNIRFYSNLAQNYSGCGLDMWLLKFNGQPSAFVFSIVYKNKVYGMRWGYNQKLEQYSPAKVLLADVLKYFFEQKYSEYDMQGKFDEFKSKWTDSFRKQTELIIFNKKLKSRSVFLIKKILLNYRQKQSGKVLNFNSDV